METKQELPNVYAAMRKFMTKVFEMFESLVLVFFAVLFIYPILWLLINSFKTNAELFKSTWSLPQSLSLENYIRAFEVGKIGTNFLNSVIIAVAVVVTTTLLAAMAAYGLTRLRWKWAGTVLSIMLLAMMIPAHATVIPLFSMFNKIRIGGTYLTVIIPQVVFSLPIAILIYSSFFSSIPKELEEAAAIDGCSAIRAFFTIILPISTPVLVTVAVITFIGTWNDLLFPRIFLSDPEMMPLPVGLTNFKGRYSTDYVGMIAAVVVTVVPSILFYIFLHKRVVGGMTAGALKG